MAPSSLTAFFSQLAYMDPKLDEWDEEFWIFSVKNWFKINETLMPLEFLVKGQKKE